MKWSFAFAVLSVVLGAAASVRTGENLCPYGDFEGGIPKGWHGGNFGGGKGALRIAKTGAHGGAGCLEIYKEIGPGGNQAIGHIPFGDVEALELRFFYKGSGNYCFGYEHLENGKKVKTRDPLGRPAGGFVTLKTQDDWTEYRRTLIVSPSYRLPGAELNLGFQTWGGEKPHSLFIDDLSVTPVAAPGKDAPKGPSLKVTVKDSVKRAGYGSVPYAERHDYAFTNGYLTVDGKPAFLIGNGCDLGAAQATPTGLWLAKMQGVGLLALEGGTSFAPGKVSDGAVTISGGLVPGNVSWLREAQREGFLVDACLGQGPIKWSPLKGLSKKYPDFREVCYRAGHGVQFDCATPLGRDLACAKRSAFLDHVGTDGNFICEISREPGQEPSNARIRRDFRVWAQRKYGTLAEACRVWGKNYACWEDVLPIHLDDAGMAEPGHEVALRKRAKEVCRAFYWDWLLFLQEDVAAQTANEIADLRAKYPTLPYTIDLRAHQTYTEGYMAYDPSLIEPFTDISFIHYGFDAFDYNESPWHAKTLADETCFPFFTGAYFRNNSAHPIVDSEDIVSKTRLPGSNAEAMRENDIAGLHRSPWKFRLESAGEDGRKDGWEKPDFDDTVWGEMTVPGCWDEQDAYRGKSGIGWYRKTFVAKANKQDYLDGSRKFLLYGRGVAQDGEVWLNGVKVGEVKGWDRAYSFDIGRLLAFNATNTLVWRVNGNLYKNGLRLYCHILPHDRINAAKPFGEKQYASMYWTWLMRGLSATLTWNWHDDMLRSYLAQLAKETQFAAETALPEIRHRTTRIAYLYGYTASYGLPSVSEGVHARHLDWFNACVFAGTEPDVLGEQMLVKKLDRSRYDLLLVPHCAVVRDETLAKVRDFAAAGGRVILTEDSLGMTFTRYAAQAPLDGAVVASKDLDFNAVCEFLKPYLPKPVIGVRAQSSQERPLIERLLVGGADRKMLYLHNWGGLTQTLELTLPKAYDTWRLASIRGAFERADDGTVRVTAPAQAPVVAVLSKAAPVDPSAFTLSDEKRRAIDEIVRLNREVEPEKADVLFPKSVSLHDASPSGKVLYPTWLAALDVRHLTCASVDPYKWTPALLAGKKAVILVESKHQGRDKLGKDPAFRKMMADYVKGGGRLLMLSHTSRTINSGAPLMEGLGAVFGWRREWNLAVDAANCGYGDPFQICSTIAAETPFAANGAKAVQLYALTPLVPTKGSRAKTVVAVPGGAAMMYLEEGKGRVFVSADNLFAQPGRIEAADNGILLDNILDWMLE